MHAQIVLFDGFDPMDVIAPFEVLSAGGDASGGQLTVELVSAEGAREVTGGTGSLALRATARLDPHRAGIIVVPGASGPVDGDPEQIDTIPVLLSRVGQTDVIPLMEQALAHPDVLVTTVCGGSLALAMAGLLVGRNAVTHTLGNDVLEATGVNVIRARVVDNGDLITAGGVTSGLDLGLYILERELGPQIAADVETLFEYERRGTPWRNTGAVPVRAEEVAA